MPGECHEDRQPVVAARRGRDVTVMSGRDRLHDREAQPVAPVAVLRVAMPGEAVERLEHRDRVVGIDRIGAVDDREIDAVAGRASGDANPTVGDVVPDAVVDEVVDQAFEEIDVAVE
jgi:hypothetical protein